MRAEVQLNLLTKKTLDDLDGVWRWRPEPRAVMGFSKTFAQTVLLDLEAGRELARYRTESPRAISRFVETLEQAVEQSAPPRSFSAPETVHVELTRACPFTCPACYMDRSSDEIMAREVLEAILRQSIDAGVLQIAFGGGEPLLHPFLDEALALVSKHHLGASITTTGVGLDERSLARLKRSGLDHLQVSIPVEAGTQDPGLAKTCWPAIERARRSNMRVGVNVIATRTVCSEMGRILRELFARGVTSPTRSAASTMSGFAAPRCRPFPKIEQFTKILEQNALFGAVLELLDIDVHPEELELGPVEGA